MSAAPSTIIEPFAIAHATLVTGDAEGTTLNDMTVIVGANGRIEQVSPSLSTPIPSDYHMLDATGKTVMPGLINAHAHLFSGGKPINPKLATPTGQRRVAAFAHSPLGRPYIAAKAKSSVMTQLCSGVTTLRTLGDVGYEAVALRDRIDAGEIVGPRLLASGPLLAIPEGHGAPLIALVCPDEDAARANTLENISHGANAIKIAATGGVTDAQELGEAGSPQMTVEQMRAICDAAHESGVIVAAHAQSTEGVRRALLAGVDTIEHGAVLNDDLIELFLNNPNALRGWSALIPTLSAALPLLDVDQSVSGITDIQLENSRIVVAGMLEGARQAREAGLRVGVGTDAAMTFVTQYGTWRELDLLVKRGGFTAAEALHAATTVNAEILGVEDVTGSISAGRAADLLVTNGNPLEDLRVLEHPDLVVAEGHPIWRPDAKIKRIADLDEILDQTYAS
ncbi:metal-dependent hydrolase family protein [Bifidobacterium eulemuris]|uniref:Amidohydrolase family protein n=1 Tax=Bifidobacterium eulemuris TaxID=1765219 RepID=A0A261GDQ3_9BIFI|nr:amidohydrolase family protein [Bifidobacterium eulemuris]OZG69383.1 imidazolonepropionase [Bifidobacterium eulemuris]QOL31131.1 amidohydrolase family protein [Bifidobacterium eulemuris]